MACLRFASCVATQQTPHFGGCSPRWRLRPSNSNSGEISVQCTYPPSFIIVCLVVRKLSCSQSHPQTHRQTDFAEKSNIIRNATTLGNDEHQKSEKVRKSIKVSLVGTSYLRSKRFTYLDLMTITFPLITDRSSMECHTSLH